LTDHLTQDPPPPLAAQLRLAPLLQGNHRRRCRRQRRHTLHPEQPIRLRLDPPLDPQPLLGLRGHPHRPLHQPGYHLLAPPWSTRLRPPIRRRRPLRLDSDGALLERRRRSEQSQLAWPDRG
jgi:hypothetical protein